MLSVEDATARVARGAAHLDQVKPGWHARIDVGTLTLQNCARCVLGQLYGDFSVGVTKHLHFSWLLVYWTRASKTVRYGFALARLDSTSCSSEEVGYLMLQDAWIAAIADRQLAATPQPEHETVSV